MRFAVGLGWCRLGADCRKGVPALLLYCRRLVYSATGCCEGWAAQLGANMHGFFLCDALDGVSASPLEAFLGSGVAAAAPFCDDHQIRFGTVGVVNEAIEAVRTVAVGVSAH